MLEKCHFIGIGGIGMSGLARLLLGKNALISGSDVSSSSVTDALVERGAKVYIGHSAKHIEADMTVVYSTDIKKDNPEYQAALHLKCPLIHRSALLQKLMESSHGLAIAGTHGKTTTSALLTWVLIKAGLAPSYAIGGIVPQLNSNAGSGQGAYFVVEACESDGTFLNYTPFGAIVTNIDFDHMDHFGNEERLVDAFRTFINKVLSPQHLFWCGDDFRLRSLYSHGISYGFSNDCILNASNFKQQGWSSFFDVEYNGKTYRQVELSLIGKHNALNALAVFGMALSLGIEETDIREGLKTFGGVLRRCEKKAETHGILFLDDYAHHPTEVYATLKGIRGAIGERRLVAVYQPHRYTRAKECMGLYGGVFNEVDVLFVTEIYAAREEPIPGITHDAIIAEIQSDLKTRCQYIEREKAPATLSSFLRPHDVLVTLGAGDVTKLSDQVRSQFAIKAPSKLTLGVLFGGMSVEHDVSLLSAENILNAINSEFYDIKQFGITRKGGWIVGPEAKKQLKSEENRLDVSMSSSEALRSLLQCDILFPVMHGTCGEDGTLQGLFEMFLKAYVGCDHRSAAICMDKVLTKRLAADNGIAILRYVTFTSHEWKTDEEHILKDISDKLTFPLFVKPVHLGSTIGVHKVEDKSSLLKAIQDAFRFDNRLIVENGIFNVREIEFSVLGNDEITVFPPGEIYAGGYIHDYDSKYGQNPAKPAAEFAAKANLSPEKIHEGMELAKKAYRAVGCTGMARVDVFLDTVGNFWFNEINPIPGFTKYSLYPIICAANGLALTGLIDRLIILGLHRRRQQDRLEIKA